MVKFAVFGQDHEVRSFHESLADAAVARGGEGTGACSRDKLSISIPAGCVLRLNGTKDQRRPVTLLSLQRRFRSGAVCSDPH